VRHSRTAAIVLVALAAALGGCGGSSSTAAPGGFTYQKTLTIYSDLPLQGPQGALMTSIVYGEKLALYQAGGRVGKTPISFASLNDAQASADGWTYVQTGASARAASQDLKAIAYIGDFDSAATAISLPLTNENDILQVSPASPYIGLTSANPYDDKGEPQEYYPEGTQTFAHLMPTDVQEAAATTAFMGWLAAKRLYVLSDLEQYDAAIAPMVAADATQSAITVVGQKQIDTDTNTKPVGYAQIAAAVAATHPDAVLVGAAPGPGAEALWQELHSALPNAKLFAPSTLATAPFLATLGAAASATYVTSPILELKQYPRQAQSVLAAYRKEFGLAPTAYTLYGYAAMQSVLAAIRAVHAKSTAARYRLDVVAAYFHLGVRNSVIGRYSINSVGDSSLSDFDGYRVGSAGQLIELHSFSGH
jgi:branched-chain amino acid transport system substrate-binding protein